MNRPRCKRRYSFSLSLLTPGLILLLACCAPAAGAAGLELRPFNASYDLFSGGLHIATTEMKLERAGKRWRFSSLTRAYGIYAWFTSKQPYTETLFSLRHEQVRLHEILVADKGSDRRREAARFNWSKGRLDVLRKGKRSRFELRSSGGVYDYLSIHLLAAGMAMRELDESTIDFYRKGKLVKSRLVFDGEQPVEVNGKATGARVYEQRILRSDASIRYYYDLERPLLPLRIERLESGESPSVLMLRKVDWRS